MAAPVQYAPSPANTSAAPRSTTKLHPLAKLRGQSRAGATLSNDSLTTYMNQIRRTEVMSREDQDELARAYVDEGDLEAGKTLIWTNLRLVIKIARDFHRSGQHLMELIQAGNLGLTEALLRFDPEVGTPFVGYAHFWIRAMILNHLLDLSQPVRLGSSRDGRKLFFNLKKARRALIRRGLEPTPQNVAEYLEVDPDEVVRVAALLDGGGVVHLDAPKFGDDESTTGIDFLVDQADFPEDSATQRLFRNRLAQLVEDFEDSLPDARRAKIWRERMIAVEPRYLKDLGKEYGVSKERIRQLEMDIRRRFRTYLKRHFGDELQDVLPC